MAPATSHSMSTYEARKASFLQKEAVPGPSRKKAAAAATTKPSWPHPFSKRSTDRGKGSSSDESSNKADDVYPSPRSLANLGLYYDPTSEANDQCSVYPDGQIVSGWRQGQSALERLEEEDPLISWVMIEKSKRKNEEMKVNEEGKMMWARQDEAMYPSAKAMIDARWRTYGGAWPLDGKKGWKPTSKKLASAGFHFSPNDDEEDCVSCAYCQCSLGGWEKTDDPVKEHQKRKPGCAIFVSELEKLEKKQESSARAANSSVTKGSRTASRKRAAEPEDVGGEEATTSTLPKSKPSNSSHVVQDSSDVQKKTKEIDKEEEEESKPAAKKRKKAAPAKSKSASKKATVIEETVVKEIDEKEEVPPSKVKAKKTTRKVPIKKMANAEKIVEKKASEMEIDDREVEASDFEEAPSRSDSRDSEKDQDTPMIGRAESPPTSPESEDTFKTPKQTTSSRPTEKTPKASSPLIEKSRKATKEVVASILTVQKGDLAPFEKLDTLSLVERSMTVEEWLRTHVKKACSELEAEGIKRIATLRGEMDKGRAEAERILRGINVN